MEVPESFEFISPSTDSIEILPPRIITKEVKEIEKTKNEISIIIS